MRLSLFVCLLAIAALCSCTAPRETGINYLENTRDTSIKGLLAGYEPVIQKNDLLSISIYSASINPAVDAPYNLPQTGSNTGSANAPAGFLVNADGNIDYPRLGTIKAEGLTKTQLAEAIKTKLEGQLTNPTVSIRFINYRVTVLGEVTNPGTYNVPTEKLTILEALGLAGDVTEFGRRNSVKVLRQKEGQLETAVLDMTAGGFFQSPYYYLQQNDVVIVEQNGLRGRQRNQQTTAQQVGIATGIITTIALILNFLK